MQSNHLPDKLKKYKVNQPYGPKRTTPDYKPNKKFLSSVVATIQLGVNREAKKSGITNKICDAKWAEFTDCWSSLCACPPRSAPEGISYK